MNSQEYVLDKTERDLLLKISRESLDLYLKSGKYPDYSTKEFSASLKVRTGVFVSIYVEDALRGCIGRMSSDLPLYNLVQKMTIAAATKDTRFKLVKDSDLKNSRIEVSVLTPMIRIKDISAIELGKHGIFIKEGYHSGTFLPQVGENSRWTVEEFLGHCSRDKAGIGWDGWKTAEIWIYEAIILKET